MGTQQQQQQQQQDQIRQQPGRNEAAQSHVDALEGQPREVVAAARIRQQVGTDGADRLEGTGGREWLVGGKGNDTYIVDDEEALILERQSEGHDTVRSSVSFTLSNHVERLELTGSANIYGAGNTGHDRLIGNAGNNMLNGFKGDDSIDGGAGDDMLYGDSGDDRLSGGPGDDYLEGGFGNDVLIGGIGNDTYELRRGMGQDYLYDEDATPGNADTISAGTSLVPDDIEVMRDDDDLLLRIRHTNSGIRVGSWFTAPRFRIETLRFGDGTVWDAAAIEAKAAQHSALPTDLQFGRGWGAAIIGQQAADARRQVDHSGQRKIWDTIFNYGAPLPDTIVMKRGGLIDMGSPAPAWTQGVDMIKIDAGIGPAQLKLMRDHDDLILWALAGDIGVLRVRQGFDRARIEFADGTVWNNAEIRERLHLQQHDGRFAHRVLSTQIIGGGIYGYDDSRDVLEGSAEDDWMFGFGGDDTLNGRDGRDCMYGGAGNDRMFGGGHADIMHGAAGDDFMYGGPGSDYLDGGAGNDTLVGGSEDDLIGGGLGDDHLDGGSGNDVLHGGPGRDLMRGASGYDLLYGGAGCDTCYLEAGMGTDIVDEGYAGQRGSNIIEVEAGLQPADIVLVRDGHDLQLGTGDMRNRLILKNLFDGSQPYIDAINFDDGSSWSFQELERRSISVPATAGSDRLHGKGGARWWQGDGLAADIHDVLAGLGGADQLQGHAGNDLLDGGAGDDLLDGGAGSDLLAGGRGNDRLLRGSHSDVIVFNRGDGNDTIAIAAERTVAVDPAGAAGRGPTLSLGGIRCDQLALHKSGADLVLMLGAGDSVNFESWYGGAAQVQGTLLQLVIDSTDDYQPAGGDLLRQGKIAVVDFNGLVGEYDRARDGQPGIDLWSATAALTRHYLRVSDTLAVGGEVAYHYAHHGQWNQLGATVVSAALVNPLFGSSGQDIVGSGAGAALGAG